MTKIHTIIWILILSDNVSPKALSRQIPIISSYTKSWATNFNLSQLQKTLHTHGSCDHCKYFLWPALLVSPFGVSSFSLSPVGRIASSISKGAGGGLTVASY